MRYAKMNIIVVFAMCFVVTVIAAPALTVVKSDDPDKRNKEVVPGPNFRGDQGQGRVGIIEMDYEDGSVAVRWLDTRHSEDRSVGKDGVFELYYAEPCVTNAHEESLGGIESCVCDEGFVGNPDVECLDDNECLKNNGGCMVVIGTCINTKGSRNCECIQGYEGTGIGESGCTDIDECQTNNGECDRYATCTNTPGSRECACNSGFRGNGLACTDIDECENDNGICSIYATCTNTPGSRDCTCNSGFSGVGAGIYGCDDVDECRMANGGCHSLASCANVLGSRNCECPTGYSGDGIGENGCADVDECARDNGGCHAQATCANVPGSRECKCNLGYAGNGVGQFGCVDVDECLNRNGGCHEAAICTNTPGSRVCECKPGFQGDGVGVYGCKDVNECKRDNGDCHAVARCTNTWGSRNCACPPGYLGNGVGPNGCVDKNECLTANGGCNANAVCQNTIGSRTCKCARGYDGDGVGPNGCVDKNECLTANGGCNANAVCRNTIGSRTCKCARGFDGDGVGPNGCVDKNECLTANGGCNANAVCRNTVGSRTCECAPGFAGDGVGEKGCTHINECASDPCQHRTCKDLINEYVCGECYPQYTGANCQFKKKYVVRLIESPTIAKKDWNSADRFPVGSGFVAENLEGRVLVWGGYQSGYYLPTDVVFSYHLNLQSLNGEKVAGEWSRISTTGAVHPGGRFAASIVVGDKIYIHGGDSSYSLTATLSSLTSAGHFERLNPRGEIHRRNSHRGWTYDGKAFFFGGHDGSNCRNDVSSYDPTTNNFDRVGTNGVAPSPRCDFALAIIDHRVFVHGGLCHGSGGRKNDFYILDMTSLRWSEIDASGVSSGIYGHTLSPISSSQLLLVGGQTNGGASNRVKIFDNDKKEWKEMAALPREFGGGSGGLYWHGTVEIRKENGVVVLCLGGKMSGYNHPNHMALFEITN